MQEIVINNGTLDLHKSFPYRIAWVNDIHGGAQTGLWPDVFYTKGGQKIEGSEAQKTLYRYFINFAYICHDHKANILAMPGDLITGQNPKEAGQYTMTVELPEQIRAVVQLIKEFVDIVPSIQEVWLWRGTPYHGATQTSIEEQITDKLRAEGINAKYLGEYSIITMKYREYMKKLFVTHPASSAYMYPEQAMGRDMMIWQEQVANDKLPRVDMIIRAHKHNFIEVHKPAIRAVQLPCWQFFVPYDGAMKNFARFQPDVGGVLMLFDEKLRAIVWHFIYDNVLHPDRYVTIDNPYEVKEACLS